MVQDPFLVEALINRNKRENLIDQLINQKNHLWQTPLYLAGGPLTPFYTNYFERKISNFSSCIHNWDNIDM